MRKVGHVRPPVLAHCCRFSALKVAFWVVRACRVDVEIVDLDAALRLVVMVAGMPRSIAQKNIADFGEPQATPLTSRRQALLAFTAKLVGQRLLLPSRVTKDNWAELARAPIIHAKDLLPAGHRFFEQPISGTGPLGSGGCRRRALVRMSVHVRSQNGIDPRLIAPFPAKPFERSASNRMVTVSFRRGMTTRASFQKASSVGCASGSSMIPAWTSSSVMERTRRHFGLSSVVEVIPEVSSLTRFRLPG
jgi:hypothetical protein